MGSGDQFKSVTHVIFDLDGLLLDTETLYAKLLAQDVAKLGKELTPEVRASVMGKTGTDAAQTLIDALRLDISIDEALKFWKIDDQSIYNDVKLMPGAIRLLNHLASKSIPMAIATSSASDSFKNKAATYKEIFETDKFFRHIVMAGDDPEVKFGKPHPDTFLVCAKRFDPPAEPSNVLVFEDSINGVKGALAAGMQCVHVPDPNVLKMDKTVATVTIPSLNDFNPELFGLPPF